MSFAREPKRLNEQLVFNPPPGYYQPDSIPPVKPAASFSKGERFAAKESNLTPGPGTYLNQHKEAVRKRSHPTMKASSRSRRKGRGSQASQAAEQATLRSAQSPPSPKSQPRGCTRNWPREF